MRTFELNDTVTDTETINDLLACALRLRDLGQANKLTGCDQVNGKIELRGEIYFISAILAPNDTQTDHVCLDGCLFFKTAPSDVDWSAEDLLDDTDRNNCEPIS